MRTKSAIPDLRYTDDIEHPSHLFRGVAVHGANVRRDVRWDDDAGRRCEGLVAAVQVGDQVPRPSRALARVKTQPSQRHPRQLVTGGEFHSNVAFHTKNLYLFSV